MADIIDVNIGDQVLEVYWQDEVELDLDMCLMYIKSGEKEIENYVENVAKPEIDSYIETEAKPIVSEVVAQIAEPLVKDYVDTEVKPEIEGYVDGLKPELESYVSQAQSSASASQTSAEASASSALAAETALTTLTTTATDNFNANAESKTNEFNTNASEKQAQVDASANAAKESETNSKTSEVNAKQSETNAKASETNAKTSETNAEIWAEGTDAQVQALGGTKSAKGWAEASENLNYTDITNCITKIQQDIKLEISNGTLTLKAGSKVYIPNGVGVFDTYITQADISITDNLPRTMVFFINKLGAELHYNLSDTYSGDVQPSIGQYAVWYDTGNNIIKATADSGSSWIDGWSLPICIITSASTNGFTSIDQVFNGFGYIGSTIFALPNVEGLIPNGRNADGSLNNVRVTTNKVTVYTFATSVTTNTKIRLYESGIFAGLLEYNSIYNQNIDINNTFQRCCIAGNVNVIAGNVISFSPKNVFQAVDRNDAEWASTASKPSDRYTKITIGASGSKYNAPADGTFYVLFGRFVNQNGYVQVRVNKGTSGDRRWQTPETPITGYWGQEVRVAKGDEIVLAYTNKPDNSQLYFYYDEGAK